MARDGRGLTARGFLLLPANAVPRRWRGRSVPLEMVPLLPGEMSDLLAEGRTRAELDATDEAIAHLVARGFKADSIARELSLGARTVYRRMARLRDTAGVRSHAELTVALAGMGFGSGRQVATKRQRRS